MMMSTICHLGVLLQLIYFGFTYPLHNKTACFNFELTIDPACTNNEMMLPREFVLGVSSISTCKEKISGDRIHGDINSTKYCCQLRQNDQLTKYCLPSRKEQIEDKRYQDFIDRCAGKQTCALNSKVQHPFDYASLQFNCIPKSDILRITENSSKIGETVFMYNNETIAPSGIRCNAYSMNCGDKITVDLVASDIPYKHCSITYAENNNQSTLNCSKLDQKGKCQPQYKSTLNYVDIYISMSNSTSSRPLLWLEVKATGENVTVACGESIPADVPRGCPTAITPSTTTRTSSMINTFETVQRKSTSPMKYSSTLTTNTNYTISPFTSQQSVPISGTGKGAVQETHSTDVSTATVSSGDVSFSNNKFLITIIGTSIGGMAALLLLGLAFLCYSRRRGTFRRDGGKEDSKSEVLTKRISYSDRESVTRDNPIYETDDFKLKVRESMVKEKGDHANNRNTDPYATMGDNPYTGCRTDKGEKPFGTDLQIKRNSWVNSCPDFMSEMAVSQSLAKLDDILNAEEPKGNLANDVYSKVLPKEERNKGTRPGNGELSDMYAKVVPKANR